MTKREALRRARSILGKEAEIRVNRDVSTPAEKSAAHKEMDRLRSELRELRFASGPSDPDREKAMQTISEEFRKWQKIALQCRYELVKPVPFEMGTMVVERGDTLEEILQSIESDSQE